MMKLDDFFKLLYTLPVDDYVVRLKLKYDHEKDYSYTNELLIYDGSDYEGSIYHWDNDWDEGQQDIEVIGYIPVSEIDRFYIPMLMKDDNPVKVKEDTCGACHHLIFKDHRHREGLCNLCRLHRCFDDRCVHEEEKS